MRDVSIIIPSYNRADDLDLVLPYYLNQEDVKEIIIVDDGSSMPYKPIIDKYANKTDVELIYHKNECNMGAGAGRNIGLSLASGKYILWGEDDAFLAENYISVLKKKIDGKKVLFGSIYYGIYPNMSERQKNAVVLQQKNARKELFEYSLLEGYYRLETKSDVEVPWGHALLMVEKKAYDNVKYYEGYKVNGYREETDAQIQISKAGYSIIYTSDTCCYHFPAKNSKGGQHAANFVKFEHYKIINNDLFLNRHYEYIKTKFGLTQSLNATKRAFRKNEVFALCEKTFRKLGRVLNWNNENFRSDI